MGWLDDLMAMVSGDDPGPSPLRHRAGGQGVARQDATFVAPRGPRAPTPRRQDTISPRGRSNFQRHAPVVARAIDKIKRSDTGRAYQRRTEDAAEVASRVPVVGGILSSMAQNPAGTVIRGAADVAGDVVQAGVDLARGRFADAGLGVAAAAIPGLSSRALKGGVAKAAGALDEPEKVARAVVYDPSTGTFYQGFNHGAAWDEFYEAHGVDTSRGITPRQERELAGAKQGLVEGFQSNRHRFLTREEAKEIAANAGQGNKNAWPDGGERLHSDRIKGDFAPLEVPGREAPVWGNILKSHTENGGSTFDPRSGRDWAGSDTYAVATPTTKLFDHPPTVEEISAFAAEHADELRRNPNLQIGTWDNSMHAPGTPDYAHGKHEVNLTEIARSREEADALARSRGEVAYTHLDPDYEFPTYNVEYSPEEIAALPEGAHAALAARAAAEVPSAIEAPMLNVGAGEPPVKGLIFNHDVPDMQGTRMADDALLIPQVNGRGNPLEVSDLHHAINESDIVRNEMGELGRNSTGRMGRWYDPAPILDWFRRNQEPGMLTFDQFTNLGATASSRNTVPNELASSSVLARMLLYGETPEEAMQYFRSQGLFGDVQDIFGTKVQSPTLMDSHIGPAKRVIEEGRLLPVNPTGDYWKTPTYAHGRLGGGGLEDPRTTAGMSPPMDAHATRGISYAMSKDEDLMRLLDRIAGSTHMKNVTGPRGGRSRVRVPDRPDFVEMQAALKSGGPLPGFPFKNAAEYVHTGVPFTTLAHDLGEKTAHGAQARAWEGAGNLTGLVSEGGLTYPQLLERSIASTLYRRGMPVNEETGNSLLRGVLKGEDTLWGWGTWNKAPMPQPPGLFD